MIELPAPAKINLFLHITARRPDGRHDLQTLFQFVDLEDRVRIAERSDGRIRRTAPTPGVPDEKRDLAILAALSLKEASATSRGADIEIDKRIPQGGGLGGGSSDAATVLVALDRLWGTEMGLDRLLDLASSLGADVPVFVRGLAAWAEGAGDRLFPILDPRSDGSYPSAEGQSALSHRPLPEDPLPDSGAGVILEEPWYLLVIPPCSIATADIFNAPSLPRDTPELSMPDFLQGLQRDSSSDVDADSDGAGADIAAKPRIAGGGSSLAASRPLSVLQVMARTRNDCEQVVRRSYPEVAGVLDWLESAGANPRMTGTGSTIFAPFDDPDRARRMARQCPLPCRTEVVRGRNRSSLSTMTMGWR